METGSEDQQAKRVAYVEIGDEPRVRCLIPAELAINEGDECVVEVNGVQDFGRVSAIDDFAGGSKKPCCCPELLRRATLQDKSHASESVLRSKMAMETCLTKVKTFGLEMHIVRVHFSLDLSLLTVVFGATERVDFRVMVKELSGELRARVVMKQVGVRDEAGMTGGVGQCGRCLCCATWLHDFESINVKMAKNQQLSLNPSTIGGMCGRLKCCLRFENDCYRELVRGMPNEGSTVRTPEGDGFVLSKAILKEKVKVRLRDERVLDFDMRDIEILQNAKNSDGRRRPRKDGGGRKGQR